jgi:pepF/M3 family oligoendopeptidase
MADALAPRWDVSELFAGLDSRSFASATERLSADLGRLVALYDRHDVRAGPSHEPSDAEVAAFEEILAATNTFHEQIRPLTAYLYGLVTTDATDDAATAWNARIQTELADLRRLRTRFDAWVSALGADTLAARSPAAAAHAHALHRAELSAEHLMSEAEESLFADLTLTGAAAWNRLHGEVTARLTAAMDLPGRSRQRLPVTVVRGMATDPDPEVRRAAFVAELAAWQEVEVPLAAALNAIKGEANAVGARRGWADSLEPALHANGVERASVEAMQEAMVASFPDFRRYLNAKAALLGHPAGSGLPWWDLSAPVGPAGTAVAWDAAVQAVNGAFSSYSPQLAGLVSRAVAGQWIDAEPRLGKEGGAFCMSVGGDASRVFLNFDGSFDSVQTLAHELGHAYHNVALAERTPLQRQLPMALAETASIFCETITVTTGLARATPEQRLTLLDVDLVGSCQVVVDIHSRFLFEREVFQRRARTTLAPAELCQLMVEAQQATYGDGLQAGAEHPYMWAVKPHYYSTAYYNWPYAFGLLFGIGLFARYQEDPVRFQSGYDDLLSSTGMASAAELGWRFGIDISSGAFWTASLDVLRGRIDEFVALADKAQSGLNPREG